MVLRDQVALVALAIVLLVPCGSFCAAIEVSLDGHAYGHRYDGHGALSAGASSRLLIDYPSPQREEILDILFKPGHGMSLHMLKVEIGGDTQSTDGAEPSHARTRAELNDCHVERGYESWLMTEAKKRNPDILISALAWGVPGWINSGTVSQPDYFNRDNIDYHVSWVKCVKDKLGITTDYIGIWNERPWGSTDYVVELRSALNDAGFGSETTGIVMLDGAKNDEFEHHLFENETFAAAIEAVGLHYPCDKPDAGIVNVVKKKYWASEDFSTPADWQGAGCWGRMLNSNYVRMNMTSTISWSLLWSVYPNLDCFGNGLMYAFEPWSGHYEVNPTVWTTAHTTHFTRPGWHYLQVGPNGGSGELPGGGGTYVTLRSASTRPQGGWPFDWTLVVETLQGSCMYNSGCFATGIWKGTHNVAFKLSNFASTHPRGEDAPLPLFVWKTNATHHFLSMPTLYVAGDTFSLDVAEDTIYTVTTVESRSGAKDFAAGRIAVPPSSSFPLPYRDNFEAYKTGDLAKYWSDQSGSFEVSPSTKGEGKALKQVIAECPIDWSPNPDPFSLVGGVNWTDYSVSIKAAVLDSPSSAIPSNGCGGAFGSRSAYTSLCGRVTSWKGFLGAPISGYCLRVALDGNWTLSAGFPVVLASGSISAASGWHSLRLNFSGSSISAWIDDVQVANVWSSTFPRGMAALSSGWHTALFDDFVVEPIASPPSLERSLLKRIGRLTFDYSRRTCNPNPFDQARRRQDFAGSVGLAFKVSAGYDLRVTTLLRYVVDGSQKNHTLELLEVVGNSVVSLARAVVNLNAGSSLTLDDLGFAAARLPHPVQLTQGRTYYLLTSEVAGGDAWLDQLPVETSYPSQLQVIASVYREEGTSAIIRQSTGSKAYGPINLYFQTDDGFYDKLFV
eukprot:TRINITY_DN21845_c0_g3_i1.p1 TRINITY_DN21845_c0_g3~~TRINITY_DN21845_c0_g3_i1.p1  ORF type:complete len:900 (-),score=115.96 TRINITY_DN21845_c0_g3_i1:138-2837(-)